MRTTLDDLRQIMGSQRFWGSTIRLAVLISAGVAILLIAFTALLVLLPLALIVGLGLKLYIRRRLRRARSQSSIQVIDGEYTIIDRQ
ncbi:hypothetical protein [Microvirga sp. 2TAF3]|uniref:hypothetical protein n=1 Tax=Microvirga sp. 2TAF3 TaxID=3233014 RepID=UPI003F9A7C6F